MGSPGGQGYNKDCADRASVLLRLIPEKNKEIDTRIDEANAVLRELHCSVVTKRELPNTAKLSVFKSVFIPIFIYGCALWVMTERILSQVQMAEMRFCEEFTA